MTKRNVATTFNANFQGQLAPYVLLKNVSFCACTSLEFTNIFQLTKNSKNLTLFVSSEFELNP
jgi:hypothetical protein